MKSLLDIMARLRDPNSGCPWDIQQTFESIVPYTIEEAYEVADAIERKDVGNIKEELGDLLLQVVFYAQIAAESDYFDFQDVVRTISEKMIRRHPHVFADEEIGSADEQRKAWEAHKAKERQAKAKKGILDDVAMSLPALIRAQKLQSRVAKVGFDWPDIQGVEEKVQEELQEITQARDLGEGQDRVSEEIGDLLFTCVNLARHHHVDAESALRSANKKFESRFQHMENALANDELGLAQCSADEMEQLWQQAKRAE